MKMMGIRPKAPKRELVSRTAGYRKDKSPICVRVWRVTGVDNDKALPGMVA